MLGSVKNYTSPYYPQTNCMVERLNHTLCQMLSYLITDDQKNWDEMLLHATAAHNNNASQGHGVCAQRSAHRPVPEVADDYIRE